MTNLATTNPGHETPHNLLALGSMLFPGSRYHCSSLSPTPYALRSFPGPGTVAIGSELQAPCSKLQALYLFVHLSRLKAGFVAIVIT